MARGRVKWFNDAKGFGFISLDSGVEAFVHYSAIALEGYRKLKEGTIIECDVAKTPKGLQAQNVRVISPRPVSGQALPHTVVKVRVVTPTPTQPTVKGLSPALPRTFSPNDPVPEPERKAVKQKKRPRARKSDTQQGSKTAPTSAKTQPPRDKLVKVVPVERKRPGRQRPRTEASAGLPPPKSEAVSRSDDTEWWR